MVRLDPGGIAMETGHDGAGRRWMASLLLLPMLLGQAGQAQKAPKFAGREIPDPPQQGAPWQAPETKLPRFLVNAVGMLFDQGIADPRGCEYREVEIGEGRLIKTRGFVLPERPGDAGRFVICWNGVIYPAFSVGEPVDLDAEVRAIAESAKLDREKSKAQALLPAREQLINRMRRMEAGDRDWEAAELHPPLKTCLLLRLGRADLAEILFGATTGWEPAGARRDLRDYRISYLTIAQNWAGAVFRRLVGAHVRGDDAIALDAARRLSAFSAAVEVKAEAMGFQRPNQQQAGAKGPAPYFSYLNQLPQLLADHERRAKEPPRGPIPPKGADPAARVAALVRDLDQIDVQQTSVPGSANPAESLIVRELIAEGDAAVEPLLAVLESDTRLTRSVDSGGLDSGWRNIHPVKEVALPALGQILRFGRLPYAIDDAKEQAKAIREYWHANRGVPLADRWYRILADDSAETNRWLEAAGGIVSPAGNGTSGLRPPAGDPKPGPMQGESLRAGRDPSVSALMAVRVAAIIRSPAKADGDASLGQASQMALLFAHWDLEAAIPSLRAVMAEALARDAGRPAAGGTSAGRPWEGIATYTLWRAKGGDLAALDEYAAWIRTVGPKPDRDRQSLDVLEPLWTYPDRPAMAEAARRMFRSPDSPWLPLASDMDSGPFSDQLITSPMICVPGFREAVIAALADETEVGTAEPGEGGSVKYTLKSGTSGGYSRRRPAPEGAKPAAGPTPFRRCDLVAWHASRLEGTPECEPDWPKERRDKAIRDCAAFLEEYGARFSTDFSPERASFPFDDRARLAFPRLERPATPEDVRAARAIFSLEGQGEVRVVSLPKFPMQARWLALKDYPIEVQAGDGKTRREYEQDGWIWQAEEARKGDRWERRYGFVGRYNVASVPAGEIEFTRWPGWAASPQGPDVLVVPVDLPRTGYRPGQPIVVAVKLWNRRGEGERTVPAEFLRNGEDGKPALRRGVGLELTRTPQDRFGSGFQGGATPEKVAPKREATFVPGDAARKLAPGEEVEVMRLTLGDWFDLSQPGYYQLRAVFAADSGVGVGQSGPAYLPVTEAPLR
jgi:hypothetical protein